MEEVVFMKRRLVLLLAVLMLLPGCEKPEPENPYRLKTTTIEYYDRDRETTVWEFVNTYDENGWLVEQQEYQNGISDTKIVYDHDAYGNILRTTHIHTDGTQDVAEDKLTLDDQHRIIYSESTWNGDPRPPRNVLTTKTVRSQSCISTASVP